MIEFLHWNNTQSGTAEAHAFFWVRIRDSHWGIIQSPKRWPKRAFCKTSLLYKLFSYLTPIFRVDINAFQGGNRTKMLGLTLFGSELGLNIAAEKPLPSFGGLFFAPAIDSDRIDFLINLFKGRRLLNQIRSRK